jgi:protein involved in polysaccharide export with SLBB domain
MKNTVIAREPQSGERGNLKPKKLFYSFTTLLMCFMIFFSGCASSAPYKIRAGDELRIVVWNEIDEKVLVRPDKKISLPITGEISCYDKTPEDLSKELSQKYRADTVVMVTKFTTLKDDIKELFGFLRDFSFVYFLAERLSND